MSLLIVALAYILCHGMTAFAVTPVQAQILPETTVFASLVYLPHGVRVLATWVYGWKAIPALIAGAIVSDLIFTPTEIRDYLQPALVESILIGALSAWAAFELLRLAGRDLYAGGRSRLNWTALVLVGAIASVLNSIGQTIVYSGLIGLEEMLGVLLTYAVGDLMGLVVCMVVLMFVFRWMRLLGRDGAS